MENEKYIKGFNHGFLLAKYKPTLLKNLGNIKSLDNYVLGILEGKVEFERNKMKSRYKELNKLHILKDKNRKKGLER